MLSFPYIEVGGGEGLRSIKQINQAYILNKFLAYHLVASFSGTYIALPSSQDGPFLLLTALNRVMQSLHST
jgi:hypothetical protein